jgi:predicted RNA polymerase sigma factor
VVGGLTSDEIARAFLVPVPTVQARITRAKETIAASGVPFELPPSQERRERLGAVPSVLYVIFTKGSAATTGVTPTGLSTGQANVLQESVSS